MRLSVCLTIFGLSLAFIGCGSSPNTTSTSTTVTVEDVTGDTVTIERPIERVVLEGSSRLVELAAVHGPGFEDKIVGWGSDLQEWDEKTYEAFVKAKPSLKDIPEIGAMEKGTMSVEKIIALNPDVVLLRYFQIALRENTRAEIQKLKRAGIPVVVIDFWKEPVAHTRKSLRILGTLFDREQRAEKVLDFYNSRLDRVRRRLTEIDQPEPSVYLEVGFSGPDSYSGTFGDAGWGILINRAGGKNIAEGIVDGFGPINAEYLISKNPDVIVLAGRSGFGQPGALRMGYDISESQVQKRLRPYIDRPGWDQIKAVKSNRVYGLYHGFLLSMYNFVGIESLARILYPEQFQDVSPRQGIKEFHRRFLPIEYDGTWIYRLKQTSSSP